MCILFSEKVIHLLSVVVVFLAIGAANMFSSYFTKLVWLKNTRYVNVFQSKNFWKLNVCEKNQSVILECESSGEVLKFPSVWLRDNCRCSMCFNRTLHSRMIPLKEFRSRILPKEIKVGQWIISALDSLFFNRYIY